jgi:hypothetical protein
MEVSRDTIEKIIARATREALQAAGTDEPRKQALAVAPGLVFDQKGVAAYLQRIKAEIVLFEEACITDASIRQMRVETPEERRNLAASLPDYSEIVVVTPPLSLIRALAQGDDGTFAAQLILRPLLWGAGVTLLLDFALPGYRRGEMLTELTEALASLEKAGMRLETLPLKGKSEEPKDFVSEQDVRDAAKNKKLRIKIKEGAIVTPLARDTAKEVGIVIE